jgi:hypothetical protein
VTVTKDYIHERIWNTLKCGNTLYYWVQNRLLSASCPVFRGFKCRYTKLEVCTVSWDVTSYFPVRRYQRFLQPDASILKQSVNSEEVCLLVIVFWVVTACSRIGGGYRRFGGTCCFHMQKTETAGSYVTQCHYPEDRIAVRTSNSTQLLLLWCTHPPHLSMTLLSGVETDGMCSPPVDVPSVPRCRTHETVFSRFRGCLGTNMKFNDSTTGVCSRTGIAQSI